jgi:hypothetical protein
MSPTARLAVWVCSVLAFDASVGALPRSVAPVGGGVLDVHDDRPLTDTQHTVSPTKQSTSWTYVVSLSTCTVPLLPCSQPQLNSAVATCLDDTCERLANVHHPTFSITIS